MSLENLIQVDLSQENSWNEIDSSKLSDAEKRVMSERYNEESEWIIYLTQQELEELKDAIDTSELSSLSSDIQRASRDGDINTFIQNQIAEWLSSADLVEHVEWNIFTPELLADFDSISAEALFGNEWLFHGLDLDESVEDMTSVSMSLALLEHLQTNPELLQAMVTASGDWDVLNPRELIDSTLTSFNESFSAISEVIAWFEWIWWDTLVAWNGLNNRIFRQVGTWKDFFARILDGEITSANIIPEIQEHNTDAIIENSISDAEEIQALVDAGSLTQEDLLRIIAENTQDEDSPPSVNGPNVDLDWTVPDPDASPEERASYLEDLRNQAPFWSFFAAILQFLQGLWLANLDEDWNINSDAENPDLEPQLEPEEIAPTRVDSLRTSILSRLSQWAFSGITEASIQEFLNWEWNMERFLRVMDDIPTHNWQDTLEEKIDNLLFSNIATSQTPKLLAFIEASDSELNRIVQEDGSLNGESFMLAVEEYEQYRIAYNEQETPLTYSNYFENRSPDDSE